MSRFCSAGGHNLKFQYKNGKIAKTYLELTENCRWCGQNGPQSQIQHSRIFKIWYIAFDLRHFLARNVAIYHIPSVFECWIRFWGPFCPITNSFPSILNLFLLIFSIFYWNLRLWPPRGKTWCVGQKLMPFLDAACRNTLEKSSVVLLVGPPIL